MKHQILTETKFFKLLDGMDNIDPTQLQVEYHIFIGRVIELSRQAHEQHEAMHSLVFAETELQYHPLLHLGTEHIPCMYVKKACRLSERWCSMPSRGYPICFPPQ